MKRSVPMMGDQRGSVAVAFGLSMVAMIAGIGAALDYSKLSGSRTELQSALDAALLDAGKKSLATGRQAQRSEVVQNMKSNLRSDLQPFAANVRITQTDNKLSGQVSGVIKNRFGSFLGLDSSSVAVGASVPLGTTRLEVALVLDSTGSMWQLGKMEALKQAANLLIDTLAAARQGGTEVAFGIVPFATQVRVETSNASASWISLRKDQPIAAENTDAATWDGCIMDRDKPFNSKRDLPAPSKSEEAYPAQNCSYGNLQRILPLTTDLSQVKSRIQSLTPDGNTNTTIGLVWGYNLLNPAAPMGAGAAPATRKPIRILVFLTDGLNTQDRFGQAPALMDDDMRKLCRQAKNQDIRVFTIRVIEGNDNLLRDCASDTTDFYTTNDSSGLLAVFKSIASKLVTLRLSS